METVSVIFVARMPTVADSQPESCTGGYSNSDYDLHMNLIRIIHELETASSRWEADIHKYGYHVTTIQKIRNISWKLFHTNTVYHFSAKNRLES